MKTRLLMAVAVITGLLPLAAPVSAADAGGGSALADAPEASIPFANRGGIRDWNAIDDKGIWIQSIRGQWYYATFFGPCTGIHFQQAVRFLPGTTGTLDKWSAVVNRQTGRCRFSSLKASAEPPPSTRKKPAAPTTPQAPAG